MAAVVCICANASTTTSHYVAAIAAADDLALSSGSTHQLQIQLGKVQAFTQRCGMQVASAKSIASAMLLGTQARDASYRHDICSKTLAHLRKLTIEGAQLNCIHPDQAFRY